MIVNRYPGKCKSCNLKLNQGEGFAYKNGHRWFQVCTSKACHRRLGLKSPEPESEKVKEISEEGVITMPYDRDALPLLRSLPGARWVPDQKTWSCSVKDSDLPRVIEIADQLELKVPESLRERLAEGTQTSKEALERAEHTRIDGKTLYPFQKEGVNYLALHEKALLADEMGLGKTIQALVALPKDERVIVVSPAVVKYNWRDEINLWRPDYKTTVCSGRNSFSFPEKGEIVIINYDILPPFFSPTKDSGQKNYRGTVIKVADLTEEQRSILAETTVILDECHLVKNYKAQRSAKVGQLTRCCKRVWGLSGTPLMNRPPDLYGVLCSLNMNALGSWNKFLNLFDGYKNPFGGYEFGLPVPEVAERMKRVMLRRLRTKVLPELPTKTYQTLEINNITKDIQKELEGYIKEIAQSQGLTGKGKFKISSVIDEIEMTDLPCFEQFEALRTLLAKARIPAMLEIVEGYEESEIPLVVFSAHKEPIETLEKREGWEIITGDTKPEDRRNIVSRFQNGELKGIGLTIRAGGVGITLTRASSALFVDLDWTPANNMQSEDRICRIGATTNSVLIMRMKTSNPLDQRIHDLLEYKIELAYRALDKCIEFKPPKPRPKSQDIELIEETDEELIARLKAAEEEAEREYSLGRLSAIAGREAAKVNDIPEPELTHGRKKMLRTALEYMVSRCDGAYSRDGQGFNRPDASIGHWIFNTGLRDEDDLAFRVLERILCRYRGQLKGKFEEIWKPELGDN